MAFTKEFDPIIAKYAALYNVPFALIRAVIRKESVFDPNAKSPRGALGLMQLMLKTAIWLGCYNRLDPEQNIKAGTKYLGQLLKKYDGDKRLTLAGYNAGPGNVRKYKGIPPFKETQDYVAKVLQYEAEELAGS
jgi:soluble lytic murein transglycosylase-like protein